MAFGYSTPPAHRVEYLFLDAASLYGYTRGLSNRFFGGVSFEYSMERLKAEGAGGGYTRLFYYDALPVRKQEEEAVYLEATSQQRAILERARAVDGVHVYEGDAHKRKNRGNGTGLEQKKVDVALAVDMLTHTFRRNMTHAALLTGDNDFKPLIDALVAEGMFVTLWYPPGETNAELINAADARRPLTLDKLRHWMLPDSARNFDLPSSADHDIERGSNVLLGCWRHCEESYSLYKDDAQIFTLEIKEDSGHPRYFRHKNLELMQTLFKERGYDFGNI